MGMQLIETVEVGAGGASSIEFTSIPQDGVDLLLVLSGRNTTSGSYATNGSVTYNGTGVSGKELRGTGSTVFSSNTARFRLPTPVSTANTFGSVQLYVSNYTNSSFSVSVDSVTENNATDADQTIVAQSGTNGPITSLSLGSNFAEHSTASLYKITAD